MLIFDHIIFKVLGEHGKILCTTISQVAINVAFGSGGLSIYSTMSNVIPYMLEKLIHCLLSLVFSPDSAAQRLQSDIPVPIIAGCIGIVQYIRYCSAVAFVFSFWVVSRVNSGRDLQCSVHSLHRIHVNSV